MNKNGSSPVNPTILLTYAFTVAAAALWIGGIFWAPFLESRGSPWNGLVYAIYSPVCHQVAARSFRCFGLPLAVCARCLGIYTGFLLGLGFYPFRRGFRRLSLPQSRAFVLVSLPIVVDTIGNFLRLWQTANGLRWATGVLWGTILPFYFLAGLGELLIRHQSRKIDAKHPDKDGPDEARFS